MGKLFVCPTPIGNLEDITLRVLRILKEVDIVAAEDTRHTLKLLNHFEISKKLISYHQHSDNSRLDEIIELLKVDNDIALVSDAGMPGISDPGADLISRCIEENIEIEVLPGPSASITALVGSGLNTDKFIFQGFLDRKEKTKKKEIHIIKDYDKTCILYESPHRLLNTLNNLLVACGEDRKIVICRELTKKYEEYKRLTLREACNYYKENTPRGEFILILEANNNPVEVVSEYDELSNRDYVKLLMEQGMSKKDATKKVSKERNLTKNLVYKEVLDL